MDGNGWKSRWASLAALAAARAHAASLLELPLHGELGRPPPLSPAGCPHPWTLTRSKKDFGGKTKKKTTNNQPPILGWLLSRFLVKLGVVCSWVYHIELDIATSFLGRPLEGDHAHSTDGAGHLEICDPLWNDITTWLHLRNQHLIPQKDT
jgi:hypothetical protein